MDHALVLLRKMRILIFVALVLGGCASKPRILPYSWGNIVIADPNSVIKHCAGHEGVWDNGIPRPRHAAVAGCHDWNGDIWIQDNCIGYMALPHELAHKDGIKNPSAIGYD